MNEIVASLPPELLLLAGVVALFAGFVKGAVGFALPMILISGLGSFLPADIALAGLILPTLLSNLVQGLRGGLGPAWDEVKRYKVYIVTLLVVLAVSAQAVRFVEDRWLYLFIGLPITVFALTQLVGWRLRIAQVRHSIEVAFGVVAGLMSGFSGTWGPPTVMYLTAIEAPKESAMRAQGVIYLLGSVMLLAAHMRSGILTSETAPWSLALAVPVFAGMFVGTKLNARISQARFRQFMLWVLLIAGANLIRRGAMG